MTTELSLINRALTEIAARQPITDLTSSAAGIAAAQLYQPAVETLLRQQDWEFARSDEILTLSGNSAPSGWTHEYLYPTNCVRVRQVRPATWDPYDPQQILWNVGTTLVSAVHTRVIWTDQATAHLVFTSSAVTENEMDAIFQEQLVRYLGSMLVMPIGGRPDFSREMLGQAGAIGGAGRDRDS